MGYNRKILDAERFISKTKLEDLYLVQKLPDSKIGRMFGISGGRIHRLRNKYGIKAIEYYQRHHKQEMDKHEKEFIIGTLLGDGHIRLRKESGKRSYPQLMIEQSVKHRAYVYWLKDQIKDWLYDANKPLKQRRIVDKRTEKVYHSYPFQTICHPEFFEFYNAFYCGRRKVLAIDVIEKYFTEYSFAVWLMDDGMKSKRGRRIQICTHNFAQSENKMLLNFLGDKYEINGHIKSVKRDGYILYYLDFSVSSSKFISHMLKDLVIPEMQYKLISSETAKGSV